MKKTADNIRIIGKSDGPTSVFIAGKDKKKTLRQKIEKSMYDFRRKRVIDFHLYRKTGWDFEMSISIEKTYESFSGSASGSTRVMRRYGADFRKVYRYYGVSQEDIRQHTKRFEEVVRQLTVR